jgi:hypothetical protein
MFVTTLVASWAKNRKEAEGMSLIFQLFRSPASRRFALHFGR